MKFQFTKNKTTITHASDLLWSWRSAALDMKTLTQLNGELEAVKMAHFTSCSFCYQVSP